MRLCLLCQQKRRCFACTSLTGRAEQLAGTLSLNYLFLDVDNLGQVPRLPTAIICFLLMRVECDCISQELERFLGHPHLKKYGMAPFEVFSINGKNGQKPEDCPEVPIRSESFKAIRHIVASELLSETVKVDPHVCEDVCS